MKHRLFSRILIAGVAGLLLLAGQTASALTIRVSQESADGAGDFDANVLGFINPFVNLAETTSAIYSYSVPNGASYNGELHGAATPLSGVSQLFFVQASDGLSMFSVHDKASDGSGGSTKMNFALSGGDTASFLQEDDPGEPSVVSGGGTVFDTSRLWVACCTDGFAIGSIDGTGWEMRGSFLSKAGVTGGIDGISFWQVTNSDSTAIALTLAFGRRVRFDAVPEPGTLAVFGLGLAALVLMRRRKVA